MKLLRASRSFAEFANGTVATIGNFDGVHLAHQNLISHLKNKANSLNLPLVVILFEPQPKEYFQKKDAPARLSSLREKLSILKQCQVDYVYCIKFDKVLAQTSAIDFINIHLFAALKVQYLLVGEDFRFGQNREGNVTLLKKISSSNACEVQIYSDFYIENKKISSTKIRAALQQGNLKLAAQFLGRPYGFCGRVIRGDGRGRKWGIPTANLGFHRLSLPLRGVYVVHVQLASKMLQGVANVGSRPTVDGLKNILEVHFFNFNESIYGEFVHVFFLHKLREEVKFTSVDALITQIHNDIVEAKVFLNLERAEY